MDGCQSVASPRNFAEVELVICLQTRGPKGRPPQVQSPSRRRWTLQGARHWGGTVPQDRVGLRVAHSRKGGALSWGRGSWRQLVPTREDGSSAPPGMAVCVGLSAAFFFYNLWSC